MNFILEIIEYGAFETQEKEYNMNCTLEGMYDGEALVRVYDGAGNFAEATTSCQTKLHTWNVYGMKEEASYSWTETVRKYWKDGRDTVKLAEFLLGKDMTLYECTNIQTSMKIPATIKEGGARCRSVQEFLKVWEGTGAACTSDGRSVIIWHGGSFIVDSNHNKTGIKEGTFSLLERSDTTQLVKDTFEKKVTSTTEQWTEGENDGKWYEYLGIQ